MRCLAPGAGRRLAWLALAAVLVAVPDARAALFDDAEARARIEQLRKQLDASQRAIDASQRAIEASQKAMDERIGKVEAEARDRRALIDLAGQIEALRTEIARMRGQLEVLANRAETAEKRQRDLYIDIDTRIRKIEQAKEAVPVAKPAAGPPEPAPEETKVYEAALNQFKLGNYGLAISAFQGFLVVYPSSLLAPSAQYWIGNAHYAQRDYKNAIAAQEKLLAAWPENSKAPDAMLNIATSQEAMGDRRGAQKTLTGLLARYPGTPAAASAKQRLQRK